MHKTLSVHLGSEVEASRVIWSEVLMVNPKSLTCECFGSDVQISVRVANDFLILKFPHVMELSSCLFFFPCQYIYYKDVPWFAVLLLLIEYSVVNADVSGLQILKDSEMMTYLYSLVSCPSQLSAHGYQWCTHNITCK